MRKQLFGSLHEVEIEFDSEELSPDIKGKIRVFERRHQVSESTFKDSKEFVMLIKEIWSNFTRSGGAAWSIEQRIARWLEEYFQEIGHPVTYDDLLELIRSGEITGRKILDEEKAEDIEEDVVRKITETTEDIIPIGEKIPVEESIDEDKLKKAFRSLLKKHIPNPIEKIESKVKAQTASGKDVEFTVESPYNNVLGEEGGIITTKLVNSFNEELKNIEIESVIPYDLQVKEIKSNKEVQKKLIPEKEGLKAVILLSSLAPKELLDVEYEVSSRIRRVVQIQKENEILVLRTYLDIEEVGERYVSRTLFVNNLETTLNYIEMVDFIPRSFKIVDTNPDLEQPLGELKY